MKISRKILANAVRILSMDIVENAKSGHPGAPMGMSDIAEVLWRNYFNHNPNNPKWVNRDRFVLSNGHASSLMYSILHLTGYDLSIEDLKKFRKINSKTPGHPEIGVTEGVDMTTGPLGQGISSAVGLAISEKVLSHQFNKPDCEIINHYTYVFLGDGCMMEGVSHESCSLAGTMKLGKLIAFYDSNKISIDGKVQDWFDEDTYNRFTSYGWHVIKDIDGHDHKKIDLAIKEAINKKDKPSLLICNTIIAFGSPNKSGNCISHGSPLGKKEVICTRKELKWKHPPFFIPEKIYEYWNHKYKGNLLENKWKKKFDIYSARYPGLSKDLTRRLNNLLPKDWSKKINNIITSMNLKIKNISTRQASNNLLEKIGPILPELLGGSADLTPSNLTKWSKSISIKSDFSGNYIHYGAREFGMTSIANGIYTHGGFIPYTSTFLVFSEYARSAIRTAALMNSKHIMIYTHDSIGLGEDGPTHQPIEQLSCLRMIPNLSVWRPCDQLETAISWKYAIERNGPTAIILSRQDLVQQNRCIDKIDDICKGGYIIKDCKSIPDLILISTGSEVQIAIDACSILSKNKYKIRVVSMPSSDLFDSQLESYKNFVLPIKVPKIVIEAGSSVFWNKYIGYNDKIIGIDEFGKSGSCEDLFKFFKITKNNVVNKSKDLINKTKIMF
ncbi:tktB [Wigglesworthia glossinidia endosymbiont of Glossina brevipalpis]|uniref:Transketolase n=1 Tax=Wigglesworthia glossinidia brevipalpis TaxID=36870 RepID=Q8D1X4_WIGBR|nr:tktB [Wigglesworthia glossinidia endosymbiont of Glossina brevipalpis]